MVSANAVLGKAQHGGTSTAQGDPCDEARSHVRLTVEMEAAVAGTVETTTDTTPHDIQVESTWPAKGSVVLGERAAIGSTDQALEAGKGLLGCTAGAGFAGRGAMQDAPRRADRRKTM